MSPVTKSRLLFVAIVGLLLANLFLHLVNACGRSHARARLARVSTYGGGRRAYPSEFPWMATMRAWTKAGERKVFTCSATLISRSWLLTTAHCIKPDGSKLVALNVTLGDYHRSFVEPGEIRFKIDVSKNEDDDTWPIRIHPLYNEVDYSHDFALIRLPEPVPFSKYIEPICLPSINTECIEGVEDDYEASEIDGCSRGVIAGWGRTYAYGPRANTLQMAMVPIVPYYACQAAWNSVMNTSVDSRSQLCAGGIENTADACDADSGGPLMCESKTTPGQFVAMGIISNGGNDCSAWRPFVPGVYSRVCAARRWIGLMVRDSVTCHEPPPMVSPSGFIRISPSEPGIHRVGDTFKLVCHEGYRIEGHNSSSCSISGTWEPEIGSCVSEYQPTEPPTTTAWVTERTWMPPAETPFDPTTRNLDHQTRPTTTIEQFTFPGQPSTLSAVFSAVPLSASTASSNSTNELLTTASTDKTIVAQISTTLSTVEAATEATSDSIITAESSTVTMPPVQPASPTEPSGPIVCHFDFSYELPETLRVLNYIPPGENTFPVGFVLSFECLTHEMEMIGLPEIKCLQDGYWSDYPPECQELLCPTPRKPRHGDLSIVAGEADFSIGYYPTGTILELMCHTGFHIDYALGSNGELVPSTNANIVAMSTCNKSGHWTPELAACVQDGYLTY